ncbi:hypothetical protein Ancab_031648 [Ancistrocladus abbreviatus]
MEREMLFLPLLLCSFICLLTGTNVGVEGLKANHDHLKKLFVFGDSYADTGNTNKTLSDAWKVPYGMTFPGKPDGRWCNGHILTDYVAKFMSIRTPVAFRSWKNHPNKLKQGMNFAYGGTGVFDIPGVVYPNMTRQIDLFQQLVDQKVYNSSDLQDSVVLVTLSGNDYSAYVAEYPNNYTVGIIDFIKKVVPQLVSNVERIYSMGVKQVLVANLQPLGCIPRITQAENSSVCDKFDNTAAGYHNLLLKAAVDKLNLDAHKNDYQPFILLDLFDSFTYVFNNKGVPSGNITFENPLEACCLGINQNYHCASADKNGTKLYTLCDDPKSTFFWDGAHPSQRGWRSISLLLRDTLSKIHGI